MKLHDFYYILKRFVDLKIFCVGHLYHEVIKKTASYSSGVKLTPSILMNK